MNNSRPVYLNHRQLEFAHARQKIRGVVGGRGSGKTTLAGFISYQTVTALPGCRFPWFGLTYGQLLTKALPPALELWNNQVGIVEHKDRFTPGHYVIGVRPPSHWPTPLMPVKRYDNLISFCNGSAIELVSMDKKDLIRGGNYDGGLFDEATLISKEVHDREILPTIRANHLHFGNNRLHLNRYYFMNQAWLPSQTWIIDWLMEKARVSPEAYYYSESTAYDNMDVLPPDYIETLKASLPPHMFDVEVLNKRVLRPENTFYPHFSEARHVRYETWDYVDGPSGIMVRGHKDHDPNAPLRLSFDFNAKFTSVTVSQLVGRELRYIQLFYVKFELVDKLMEKVIEYFAPIQKKRHCIILGDASGNRRNIQSVTTIYQDIQSLLSKYKFTWENRVRTQNPSHQLKYEKANEVLAETNPNYPLVRINGNTCRDLVVSITNTPVEGDFSKDKSSETRDIPQESATHLGDCFDYDLMDAITATSGGSHLSVSTF